MTGLRVGYTVVKDKALHKSFINAQELYISSAPSVSQFAALCALTHCEKDVQDLKQRFREKRDLALEILGDLVSYVPEGAFYLLVDVSRTGLSSDRFADLLLEEKKSGRCSRRDLWPLCRQVHSNCSNGGFRFTGRGSSQN